MDRLQDGVDGAGKNNAAHVKSTWPRSCAAALLTATLLLLLDIVDGRFYYRDIDDILRGIQIRQLLDHGGWFDLTIRGIDMPGAYFSPWSRLIDLPYVVIASLLSLFLPQGSALEWAFLLWQPALLVAFCLLWVCTAANLSSPDVLVEPLHIIAAFALMPLTLWEFMPGRIDHHNVQLVMLMVAIYGVSCWSFSGGFVAGIGLVSSLLIGLELAPVLAVLLLGICFAFVFGVKGGRRMLAGLGASLTASTLVGGLLFLGPQRMMDTECDTFSAPYVTALLGFSAVILPAALFLRSAGRWTRLIMLGFGACLLVGGLAAAFPACLGGPYGFVDPVVRSLWLERVQQEMSFLDFYRTGETIKILLLSLLALVLVGVIPFAIGRLRRLDAAFCIILAVAAITFLLTLLQTRFIRFPAALILLFVPIVWVQVRERVKTTVHLSIVAVVLVATVTTLLWFVVPQNPQRLTLLDYMTVDLCTDVDAAPLRGLPPGRIVAPSSLGLFLLDRLPPGMTINSISFHRAAPGMRAMFDVFLSMDSETRKRAAAPFDYLAVCRYDVAPYIENDTLFARLMRGGEWPGLTLIHDGPPGSPRFFRIDHARFE